MSLVLVSDRNDGIIHQIDHKIYLGNSGSRSKVKQLGISNVIEIGTTDELEKYPPLPDYINVKSIILQDNRNSELPIEETLKLIEELKGTILIHCNAGVSRSVSLVLAYLMNKNGISLKEAIDKLILIRNGEIYTSPNAGFLKQLLRYEMKIRGENSIILEELISLVRPLVKT